MEVSHTDLSEVTRMVLVHVDLVVVLTTGKTTTTGMLAVLADTSVTCGNVTAAVREECVSSCTSYCSSSKCIVLFVIPETIVFASTNRSSDTVVAWLCTVGPV